MPKVKKSKSAQGKMSSLETLKAKAPTPDSVPLHEQITPEYLHSLGFEVLPPGQQFVIGGYTLPKR